MGPCYATNLSLGYAHKNYWLEAGFGFYRLNESHSLRSTFLVGNYRNVQLAIQYWFVPIKAGITIWSKKALTISFFSGADYLVESTSAFSSNRNQVYFQQNDLKARKNSPYQGYYTVYQNDKKISALLLCVGLESAVKISDKSDVTVRPQFNLGFNILSSNAITATESRDGTLVTNTSSASTKGDFVGIEIGYRYHF